MGASHVSQGRYSAFHTHLEHSLVVFEDNEAVLKMCVKGRVPTLRHVTRTHRVDLDWIVERIKIDTGISMKYVKTSEQLADMLTKASFVAPLWKSLLKLHQIGHHQPLNSPPQPEPMFFAMLSVACESGKNLTKIWINLTAEPFWLETLLVVAVLPSLPLAWP